jgi:hypothetical protein
VPSAFKSVVFSTLCAWLCCWSCLALAAETNLPTLPAQHLDWLGQQIYQNECNRQPECLTSWNVGEDFPSLGIGHFIWYRSQQTEEFSETFPSLLDYLHNNGVTLPSWLEPSTDQPWPDRPSFLASQSSARMRELRELLLTTQPQQAAFIVERFSKMLATADFLTNNNLHNKLQAVASANSPFGPYALIDYVHFKGEGSNPAEQYSGRGWGLKQVLIAMPDNPSDPLASFVVAAKQVLQQRVASAPAERNEQRWLAGWHKRLDTYLPNK